ncbi:Protein NTM1-like 9 [Linum grandiflorum]
MVMISMQSLPLGFRFGFTDEKLANQYLRSKNNISDSEVEFIFEIDVCKWEPWNLPDSCLLESIRV